LPGERGERPRTEHANRADALAETLRELRGSKSLRELQAKHVGLIARQPNDRRQGRLKVELNLGS
jgi:hypothetical protein